MYFREILVVRVLMVDPEVRVTYQEDLVVMADLVVLERVQITVVPGVMALPVVQEELAQAEMVVKEEMAV